MSEPSDVQVDRRVVTTGALDRSTRLLLWAVFAAVLMLAALVAYAWLSGAFGTEAPRTAEERSLAVTAATILATPGDGSAYAIRAETFYRLGRKAEAYQVLDQGEKAVGKTEPGLLFVLRTRTALLNNDGNFAEAEKVGIRGMTASDDYLGQQGAALAKKGVTGINTNMQDRESVDMAVQLATAYMGEKKYAKAIELYNYALKLEPLSGDVLTQRGFVFLASGDKAKAKADFTEALKYLPNDPQATAGLKQASN